MFTVTVAMSPGAVPAVPLKTGFFVVAKLPLAGATRVRAGGVVSVLSTATKASVIPPHKPLGLVPHFVSKAERVVGKLEEVVVPATYAMPIASTAMPFATSSPVPPRKVKYTTEAVPDREGSNWATKASWLPALLPGRGGVPIVLDLVKPVT